MNCNAARVLIVEDDPVTSLAHRNRLSREGYQVAVASDGTTILALLREFRPDAMLLDLQMPKVSGMDVLKSIRASDDFRHLPVLVFTNTTDEKLFYDCIDAGANKVFEKGALTVDLLLNALEEVVRHFQKRA